MYVNAICHSCKVLENRQTAPFKMFDERLNLTSELVVQSGAEFRDFTFYPTATCLNMNANPFSLSLSPLHITTAPSSGALTQAIRNFAKSLENWLTGAMMNIPEEMVRTKVFV